MIDGKTISVLFNTYHPERYETLDEVVAGWCTQPVDQIWVIDGGEGTVIDVCDPRVEYIKVPQSIGTRGDYALAYATDGDFLIFADDDHYPTGDWAQTFYDYYENLGPDVFLSMWGRKFNGPHYYKQTVAYKSEEKDVPMEVDLVGVTIMCPRFVLQNLDTKGMTRSVDDFWLGNVCWPEIRKYVVPTNEFVMLPCNRSEHSISSGADQKGLELRNDLFLKVYAEMQERKTKCRT